MTDRELLVKAAKAADINIKMDRFDADDQFIGFIVGARNTNQRSAWNPLTDDGDALRLAVKRSISVDPRSDAVVALSEDGKYLAMEIGCGDSLFVATRRAIVRVAAAIGASL